MDRLDVLVIDDDEGIRWALNEIFSLECLTFEICASVARGIRLAKQRAPRLLLIDVKLGALDGIAVAEQIRDLQPGIEVFFLTGYRKAVMSPLQKDLDVSRVIEKPFDVEDLIDKVRSAVGRN